jgi:hypothetical protein
VEPTEIRTGDPLRRRASDRAAIVAAHRDPQVVRWFDGLDPYTEADATRYVEREAPQTWALAAEAAFVVAGPDDADAGAVDLRVSPSDLVVAEKTGFTMEGLVRQGYEDRGRRHDCWIGSLLVGDRAPA